MTAPRFSRSDPTQPRRAVATFSTYRDAERAVDFLADRRFRVEHTAIVARGLEYVEQVTGRMTYGRAALNGALNGAMIGFLIGWLFGLFDWFQPLVSAFWLAVDGLWFGAVVGALMAMILHAMQGGRRDFSAVGGMRAEHYDVLVDEAFAGEAELLLSELPSVAPAGAATGKPREAAASPSEH